MINNKKNKNKKIVDFVIKDSFFFNYVFNNKNKFSRFLYMRCFYRFIKIFNHEINCFLI